MTIPPKPTYIYHITHIENLADILRSRCLRCYQQIHKSGMHPVNIAHQTIQDRRANTVIPLWPGGVLHDYVPFYFAPRSPMLYAIQKNQVEGYRDGQAPIIHLVSSVEKIIATGHSFIFTDGHATMSLSQFYSDVADLSHIDWATMQSKYWNDTIDHPDRRRLRQAEFLVYNSVVWEALIGIGVLDAHIQNQVNSILASMSMSLPVAIRPHWYYE